MCGNKAKMVRDVASNCRKSVLRDETCRASLSLFNRCSTVLYSMQVSYIISHGLIMGRWDHGSSIVVFFLNFLTLGFSFDCFVR